MSGTGTADATANQIEQSIEQIRGALGIFRALMRGRFTGDDLQGSRAEISTIAGLFISQPEVMAAIEENWGEIQPQIIERLTDADPAQNLLVRTLSGMSVEQIQTFLQDNPDMMSSIQGIINETAQQATLAQGMAHLGIPVPEAFGNVGNILISELTSEHLNEVDDTTLREIIINLPDEMFREVMENINEVRAENRLGQIAVPDGELGDSKASLFDSAISITGNGPLDRIFNYFANNPNPYDRIRESVPEVIQERLNAATAEPLTAEIMAQRIHAMATENNGAALAAALSTDENKNRFSELITVDFINRNYALFEPHAGDFMSDSLLDTAAGMINSLLQNFPFIGQLLSLFTNMIESTARSFGFDINIERMLAGDEPENSGGDRTAGTPDAEGPGEEDPNASATAPEQQGGDPEQHAALAIAASGPRIG
ncbi:MAG: hypothetical protein ACK4VI_01600 [Alphaproteobacteria bacterium]